MSDVLPMAMPQLIGLFSTPGAGPWMRLLLAFDGSIFTDASFEIYGCPTAMRYGD